MLFVNPLFLAGIGLVAVPIVLHLIMQRRPKHFEFPAVRFLQRRHDTNRRRLQLRHLLLLALRAAVIALLALALARPSVKLAGAWGSQEAPVAAALVVDTAVRMGYRLENRTRLEVAQDFARNLMGELPRESQIAVLDTHGGPALFQADRGAALQRLNRLETTATAQSLVQTLEGALDLVGQSPLPRKEIYVFTDLSQGAWPGGSAARLQDRIHEAHGPAIYLIDVGVERPVNFSLGELRLSAEVLSNRSPLQVDTQLASLGAAGERTVELFLLDAKGQPQRRSQQVIKVKADEAQPAELRVGALELGLHQGFVRVMGQDGLADDDTRYFTIDVKPPWRVLIAAAPPVARKAVFLAEALAPTAYRKQGRARFECELIDLNLLPQRALDAFDVVCLLDPRPLAPETWRKLANFAGEGHGVAVFLGRNATPVDSFNHPMAQDLLAGPLLRQARSPNGSLAPRDYEHPALALFRPYAGGIPWDQFPVFRYWELGKLAEGAKVILPYRDQRPALVERPIGSGRAVTMTTPISDNAQNDPWNLLPVGEAWPFWGLVNQLTLYLAGSADEQFNYHAGQTAVLHLDRQAPRTPYVVTDPKDTKFSVSPDPERPLIAVTATGQPGNYRVQAGGQRGGFDRGFSVNLGLSQTDLRRVSDADLKALFGSFDFRLLRSEEQLDRAVSTARVGRELFPLLILLVALALAAEHIVANRFYGEPAASTGRA